MLKIYSLIGALLFPFSIFSQSLSIEKTSEGAWIKEGGEKVLFYQARTKSLDGKYARADYVHPLYNVDGYELTEDFPKDHLHHRGVFWTWHQVLIGNKQIGDAWECKDFIWDVQQFNKGATSENAISLEAHTLWKSPLWKDSDGELKAFMKEKSTIRVHEKEESYRLIDFEISLLALEENLKIGGSNNAKGYGGFSIRIKMPSNIKFTAVNGAVEPITNQLEAGPWMDVSGALAKDKGQGGVIIISHPDNPTYPETWIIRKKGSMQNPVFPGQDPVLISTNIPTVLKYRLVVYVGELSEELVAGIVEKYQ